MRLARGPVPITFGWPLPSKAKVIERINKEGKLTEVRYTLHLSAEPGTRHLLVRRRDFELLIHEGVDVRSSAFKEDPESKLVLHRAMPDLRVGRDGKVVNVVGRQKAITRAIDSLMRGQVSQEPEARAFRDSMRRMLRDPEQHAMLESRVRDAWHAWVEIWLLPLTPPAGATVQFETKVPALMGHAATAKVALRNRGAARGHPGHAWLTASCRFDARQLRKLVARQFERRFREQAQNEADSSTTPRAEELRSIDLGKRFEASTLRDSNT